VVRRRRYFVGYCVNLGGFELGGFWGLTRALRDMIIVRGLSGILNYLLCWKSFVDS
jgi:hypothetical protein